MQEFGIQRKKLKNELALTCKTIALSLDIWESQNHLPILGIIGHGLTDEFEYRERLLEFAELQGIHSGENLSIAVENMLIELGLEDKLSSITGDNASNNEAMASELFLSLSDRPGVEEAMPAPLYRGLDSYIRCLAHVLNLIVKDILRKLRVLALWIYRSPQRRQKWKEICKLNNLPDKFVAQVNKFLNLQEELPPFTLQDWSRLEQIHTVLHKFNVLTLFISKRNPQISLADPIYYELHELLDDNAEKAAGARSTAPAIDKYFDSPPINIADTTGQNWLCNWWKMHKGEYPRMAAAARDYLAIPASEVGAERVFSTARDVLGIRRYSLKGDTIRMLMLIRDGYKW
ncbi:hypothetical protein PENANT_c169G07139 [Penicillium antarcticum]|uniref:HAT C-terminal dimerisation domain-containing protein n=1 Tax=Penicillium antarcticum TaxID=416450 RepID=A0A1V6PCB8_9EURO|nr:hypothetical protein PENANT_c169G07139 [Penicillium antarcticum]